MSQSPSTPDPVAWMVRSGAGHSIGQPELVEALARGNAERYNRLAGWRDKPYTVVPLYDHPSALPATTPSVALEASPMVCACGHVHATAIQDGVTSVFHRCRFDGCACRAYRPPFAPEPAPQPCSHCDATGDLNGEPCGACLGSGLATPAIIPIVALLESCADDREQEAQDSLDRTPEAFEPFMDDARQLRALAKKITERESEGVFTEGARVMGDAVAAWNRRVPPSAPDTKPDEVTHELKVWPEYFDALNDGRKSFEYRRDDRTPRFATGDVLHLREFVVSACDHVRYDCADVGCLGDRYTGRECWRRVTYIARGGMIPGNHCVMALEPLSSSPPEGLCTRTRACT